jgi:hypothetical protein
MIVLASRGVKRVRFDRGVMRNHPHGEMQRFLERPVRRLRALTALIPGRSDPRSAVRTGRNAHTRKVAIRSVEVFDKTRLDRVRAAREDNGDRSGRCLWSKRRREVVRINDRYIAVDQFSRKRREAVVVSIRRAELDAMFLPSTKPVSFRP